MRKLATVQEIVNLEPIPGADAIEKATVKGWHLVVKKDEFKIGDLCVYFEVDSLLPEIAQFEFLAKNGVKTLEDGTRGYRLRTIKLRNQVSQGLALPVNKFDEFLNSDNVEVGDDVSKYINVVKYEAPIPACLSGRIKGHRPDWIPKTDEMRVQNLVEEIKQWAGTECYITEKVDGASSSFYYAPSYRKKAPFGVCSRNLDLIEDEKNSFWQAARNIKAEDKMKDLNLDIVFQGELLGPGIQKNRYKLPELCILMFNAFTIEEGGFVGFEQYLKHLYEIHKSEDIFEVKRLTPLFNTVPMININFVLDHTVDELVELAKGFSELNPEVPREGIVIRAKDGSFSFKVINPDFLLKFGE